MLKSAGWKFSDISMMLFLAFSAMAKSYNLDIDNAKSRVHRIDTNDQFTKFMHKSASYVDHC